jgi:hypothetical protein
MPVSRGHALLCSAALHTLGIGVAGWTSYGHYRSPAETLELHTTRAYALHFLTLTRPKPQPEPRRRSLARPQQPVRPPEDRAAGPRAPEPTLPAAALARTVGVTQKRLPSPLDIRELSPGATVEVVGESPAPAPRLVAAPPPVHGVDRAAALVTPAGSACPDLPLPETWSRRNVAVAVALEVDSSGAVDRSKLHVVQSPGRDGTERQYYPRIYVVGAKAGRSTGVVDPAAYDSVLTGAVEGHVASLRFTPAMRDGRPVSSAVLIACHWSPG